jgi:tRNA A37 threonylcarbamoyladenosine modification protein TsaB
MNLPRAAGAATLALREWAAGRTSTADELLPNYLRPSEAELNLHHKKK